MDRSLKLPLHLWKLILLIPILLASEAWAGGGQNVEAAMALYRKWDSYMDNISTAGGKQVLESELSALNPENTVCLLLQVKDEDGRTTILKYLNRRSDNKSNKILRTLKQNRPDVEWAALWERVLTMPPTPPSSRGASPADFVMASSSDEESESGDDNSTTNRMDTSATPYKPSSRPRDTRPSSRSRQQHQGWPQAAASAARTTSTGAAVLAASHSRHRKQQQRQQQQQQQPFELPSIAAIPLENPIENPVERKEEIELLLGACSDALDAMNKIGRQIKIGRIPKDTIMALAGINIASLVELTTKATGMNLARMSDVFTAYEANRPFTSIKRQLDIFHRILGGSRAFNVLGKNVDSLIPLLLIQQERIAHQQNMPNTNIEPLKFIAKKIPQHDDQLWELLYQLINQLDLRPETRNLTAEYRFAQNIVSSLPGIHRVQLEDSDEVARIIARNVNSNSQRQNIISADDIAAQSLSMLTHKLQMQNVNNPDLEVAIAIFSMKTDLQKSTATQGLGHDQAADLEDFDMPPPEEAYRNAFETAITNMAGTEIRGIEALVQVLLRRSRFIPPELMTVYRDNSGAPQRGYHVTEDDYSMDTTPYNASHAGMRTGRASAQASAYRKPSLAAQFRQEQTSDKLHEAFPENSDRIILSSIKDITDWQTLGRQLGVPNSKIKEIEMQYNVHGIGRQRSEIIVSWLSRTPTACWANLITALEAMGEHRTAQGIQDHLIPQQHMPVGLAPAYPTTQGATQRLLPNSGTIPRTPGVLALNKMKHPYTGDKLNVFTNIGAGDIRTFGEFLLNDTNGAQVRLLIPHHQDLDQSARAIIQFWVRRGDTTDSPVTWLHLIDSLNDANMGRIASGIKETVWNEFETLSPVRY